MDWREARIHVIDFEGTSRSGVVEFGAVTLYGGLLLESRTALCAPTGEVAGADLRVHGIQETDTSGLDSFGAHFDTFVQLRRTGPLCAHHASVEMNLLKDTWPYPGEVPDFPAGPGRPCNSWGPLLDTRRIYAALYPDLASTALADLLERFDLVQRLKQLAEERCPPRRRKTHCALFDALGAALLLLRLAEEPDLARLRLEQLFAFSGTSGPGESPEGNQGELAL
ncbi:MAG: 3'-5' exonuclease [Opitutales bacterium]